MAETDFKDAKRKQMSLLAPIEKRCLIWLAERMPAWVNSDHLTLLGLLGMAGAGASYALGRWDRCWILAAIPCLAVNWFGDSLDGTLARVRQRLRPRYGFYVDHVVDAFGTLFLVGGLGASGWMSPSVAAGILIVYFLLSIESYLATHTIGTFHLSHWKMSPTELRILLAAGTLVAYYRPYVTVAGKTRLFFDVGGAVGIAGMVVMLIVTVIRHTVQLYREERV